MKLVFPLSTNSEGSGNVITDGSGITNTLVKFTSDGYHIGNSSIIDTGSLVTIDNPLTINGNTLVNGNLLFPTSNYSTYNPYIASSNDGTNSYLFLRSDNNIITSPVITSISSGTSQNNNTALFEVNNYSGNLTSLSIDTSEQVSSFFGSTDTQGTANTQLSGTIAVTNNSTAIVGTGTSFLDQLTPGGLIADLNVNGPTAIKIGNTYYTIESVTSDTEATLSTVYTGATASGITAYTDSSFYAAITSNNELAVQIYNDGSIVSSGVISSSTLVLSPLAYFFEGFSSPLITDNSENVIVTADNFILNSDGTMATLGNVTIGTNGTGATLYIPVNENDLYSPSISTYSSGGFSVTAFESDSFAFYIDQFSSQNFTVNAGGSPIFTVDFLGNAIFAGYNYLQIAVGDSYEYPETSQNGMLRFNTDLLVPEFYSTANSAWSAVLPIGDIDHTNRNYALGFDGYLTSAQQGMTLGVTANWEIGQSANIGIGQPNPVYSLDLDNTYGHGEYGGDAAIRLAQTNNIPSTPGNSGDQVIYNQAYQVYTVNDAGLVRSLLQVGLTEQTGDTYNVAATDFIVGINSPDPVSVVLPAPNTVAEGQLYFVKDESGAALTNPITVTVDGGANIDGSSSFVIAINYSGAAFYSNGTQWFTI